jgi:GalNAc-alpha-(1->4)-GalNAc-alpha-(1->3)-diNAcBac-PP-undecaprenol alpha-1,4-N-acetyl-D-galactosaminyltransferase
MIKKICFIGAGLEGGGQERAFTSLANHYASKGFDVSIILLFKTGQFFELHNDIKIYWPPIDRTKHHRLVYALLIIPYIRKTIKHVNPQSIVSFGEWFNPFVIFSTRGMNVPLFVSDRMSPLLNFGFFLETAKKMMYPLASGIIAQTSFAAKTIFNKTGATKIKVIPNPVNVVTGDTEIKKNQFVTVGRLSVEKGHQFLIEAFAKMKNKNWTLQIVGDGKERMKLEKMVSDLDVSERVFFHGHLKEFSHILCESKVFVLPSLSEGFPNALIEAMSVPLACISSDCVAGPSDIITHDVNGLLVKPKDVESLSDAMDSLANDEELLLKLSNNAYLVRNDLNFDKVADQYLNFIFPINISE